MKPPLRTVLRNFLNHFEDYEARKKLCDDQYEQEFQQLKNLTDKLRDDPEYSRSCALKDVNRPKNRYKDIVPYDKSRVILPKCDGIPGSDYINASYIKGASGASAYIAAQGPLPNTVIDFWRMIWICKVQVLVMACNEKEVGRSKCEIYWPLKGEVMNYGKISVELVETSQMCPEFLIRTLLVKCGTEMRDVYQFHYTTWPDHGVPESVYPILELVRLMRDCQATEIMPILVHCSAGCGRTGTICAVDYVWACLRQGKLAEDFSLFQIALELRRQRIAMIQTKEQYILAHRAVATLFEQQLNVIDCHIYVNVDEDGEPLMWKELSKNKPFPFKKENSSIKETSPSKDPTNCKNKEKRASIDGCAGNTKSSFADSSRENSDTSDQQSSTDNKISSKMSISDSLVDNSEGSFSRNSYLSQQSIEDSIPFIDDDDVCIRPNCGRAYLNLPSCDSIVNHFDPFVDKVAMDTDDSSPDADPQVFNQKLLDFQSKNLNSEETHPDSVDVLKTEEADQSNANVYSTLPSSSRKKEYPTSNRESYPPSTMGMSRFHNDSISDVGSECTDGIKKGSVARRPSISKLRSLFEKSGISFKSSSDGGKRSLFRNNSHSVSRAGSAPPSLSCMDKNADVERESILMMVTRKFRSASVRNEREVSSKPYSKSEHRRSNPGSFKEGIATLSRTVSFNISNTLRRYSPSKTKTSKPLDVESERVSSESHTSTSEPSNSKLPQVKPKGKSMWYDKSSLPRPVTVIKPFNRTSADVPKTPTDINNSQSPSFSSIIDKPPKLLPFFSTLNKTSGKDTTTMWYSESVEASNPKFPTDAETNPDLNPKLSYKSRSKVLPFIHSIAPWKKSASKSPLSSPDSPKSLATISLPLSDSSNSRFYTETTEPIKQLHIIPLQKKVLDPPACPIPEEIIPLSNTYKDTVVITEPTTNSTAKVSSENLPKHSEMESTKQAEVPVESLTKNDFVAKSRNDVPPAIPKKLGKHKQTAKQALPTNQEVTSENAQVCEEKPTCKDASVQLPPSEKPDSVPSSPKDLYINVNIKAKKNIEQIENVLRNNPRGAIIDLTSRESYCMEEELDNALKQLDQPDENKLSANNGYSKFPGYEVIWPENSYPNGHLKLAPGIKHCKTGLCYSPPLRRSVKANIGLVKCRSCSNIDCLGPNENVSLGISKDPPSTPNKQLFTDAVVELNTLLDRLTTRTLAEGTDLNRESDAVASTTATPKATSSKVADDSRKDISGTHSVTLLSKSNASTGSPPKEEEIIFHFPPPPPLPPPEDAPISETFNIIRKNGSLVVSETNKTKDTATCTSQSEIAESANNPVPQPAPRKSKQVAGLRRSASYTNVFTPKAKGGYENVILDKYQTFSRLQIETKDDTAESGKITSCNTSNVESDPQFKKLHSSYVNVDPLKAKDYKIASLTPKQTSAVSGTHLQSPFQSYDNKSSTYGKVLKISGKLHISEDKQIDQHINDESISAFKKKPVLSKKTERAPMPPQLAPIPSQLASIPPQLACSLQTKDGSYESEKHGIPKKFPSRKSEKAPLPPPLLQKSASTINAAKTRPNYANFHPRSHIDETKVLPALHENITNNSMSQSAIGITIAPKIKNSTHSIGQGLTHSQSDASVFKALKERKALSLGRGVDPKRYVMNKVLQQSKDAASASSSDSDSSYERLVLDKSKEQSERDYAKCSVKEQIMALNSTKSFKKEMPVAPPRVRRRNTTEINYAKVKSKEASPSSASFNFQDHQKVFEKRLHIPESPPAIPLKTKDAFEVPGELSIKGTRQRTAAWVQQSDPNFKR